MASTTIFSFLSLIAIIFTSPTTSQPPFLQYNCMDAFGTYTHNSTFHANLNTLLSNPPSNTATNDYGFYNSSNGENTDKVNLMEMCRGDINQHDCLSCLNDSRALLPKLCTNQKEAVAWYDNCMLRYSVRNIFGVLETKQLLYMYDSSNATDEGEFNQVLAGLLGTLRGRASSGDSHLKFAEGKAAGPASQTIYAHLQCTPDLSGQDCNDCLVGIISYIPNCCAGKIRGRLLQPSCNLRFDTVPYYYDRVTKPPFHSPIPSQGKSNSARTTIIIAVVAPVVSFLVLLTFMCIYLRRRKPEKYFESGSEVDYKIEPTETLQFDFQTITEATDNFSGANKLGQGGFGSVYKGRLPNGVEVAIKRLSMDSGQGDKEFKNELLLLAKLQHRNLVRLLGFCLEVRERILVYEFLPNKSLDYFLFDPIKHSHLNWERRYLIIIGIARGLLYLHEDSQVRILHRDLKASNVLLDEEMNPKISDFGMARLFITDQSLEETVTIVGTYGYMPPEYVLHGHFSPKSDVFSFGVLVLEIVSGRKNSDIRNGDDVEHLISFAWRNWREGTVSNIVDPALDSESREEIMRCIHIGLLCVQENVVDRPTMAEVVVMINSHSLTLPIPSRPAYFINAGESAKAGSGESANEASISDLDPR